MTFIEIRRMAKGKGVNTYRVEKDRYDPSIQAAENNIECYGTQRVEYCHEDSCLWKNDCLSLSRNSKANPR
jgi:hypothetical protein